MRQRNLDDLYGLPVIDWASVEAELNAELSQAPDTGGLDRHTCWLATIDPDGKPHVTGVGALWVDGAFWFVSGDRMRKSKNLARDPRCTLSVATRQCDLVFQGEAHKIADQAVVAAMAKAWAAQGWPSTVDETESALTAPYSAPSAGPPPWFVYRITAKTATVIGTMEPGGATRFSF